MRYGFSRRQFGQAAGALASGLLIPDAVSRAATGPDLGSRGMPAPVRQAWNDYLAAIEDVRHFLYTRSFSDRQQIKDNANETLMQIQAAAYQWVIAPRVDYPRFYVNTMFEPMIGNWGTPCPDFRYRWAFIDGTKTYRIWGKRSNSRFLDIQLGPWFGSVPMEEYRTLPTIPYPVDRMTFEPDGRFEIIASPERHPGNWIALDPRQSRMCLFVREAFYDWTIEQPSMLRIECVSPDPLTVLSLSQEDFISRLQQAGRFAKYIIDDLSVAVFDHALAGTQGAFNAFMYAHLPESSAGNHAAQYGSMAYDLQPDEALIITIDKPVSKYWSLCLADRYLRLTDYTYHQSSLNGHQARIDSDGKVRFVLTKSDPGVPNWLDPVDYLPLGYALFRQYFQDHVVAAPVVEKLRFDQIRNHLPKETPLVTAEERKANLRDRSWASLGLYGY